LCATRRIEYKKLLNLRVNWSLNSNHAMKKLLISIGLALVAGVTSYANDWRFSPDGMGGGRFYNQNGSYTGRFSPDGMGGGRFYNQNGHSIGRFAPDGMGGGRFYDED
jgi:hypothetical protein